MLEVSLTGVLTAAVNFFGISGKFNRGVVKVKGISLDTNRIVRREMLIAFAWTPTAVLTATRKAGNVSGI